MPYLIILLSSLTHFAESAFLKKNNQKNPDGGFVFMALISFAAMLFSLCTYLITDTDKGDFTPEVIPYAILSGVFYCAASFLTYLSIGCGPFAITMLILSYSIVITCTYGIIFVNEEYSVLTFVAFAIIALSLFLVRQKSEPESKDEDGEPKKKVSLKWLICITVSVVTSALYGIVLREQQIRFNDTVTSECMIITFATSAIILLVIGIIESKGKTLSLLGRCAPYAAAAGAANGATNLLSMVLNTMMALSISSPTRSIVKTAITFLYSYFILKERFLPRQIIGIILGVAAVVLLNIA